MMSKLQNAYCIASIKIMEIKRPFPPRNASPRSVALQLTGGKERGWGFGWHHRQTRMRDATASRKWYDWDRKTDHKKLVGGFGTFFPIYLE